MDTILDVDDPSKPSLKRKSSKKTPKMDTNENEISSFVAEGPRVPFFSVKQFDQMVEARVEDVNKGLEKSVFITFANITPADFVAVEKHCDQMYLKYRFTYLPEIETMIVKVLSAQHERGHLLFAELVHDESVVMRMRRGELCPMGATKAFSQNPVPGHNRSSKQPDSSFRNLFIHPSDNSFPSLVIELADSESLPHLWASMRWWLQNSNGQVRIVILIKLDIDKKTARIFKYIPIRPANYPQTRSLPPFAPSLVTEISVDASVNPIRVQGAPLRLEFDQVFSRQPNPPNERDILISAQDIQEWASLVWVRMPAMAVGSIPTWGTPQPV